MAPGRAYPGLPKRIFGLKCSQHRISKMRDVLRQYNKCIRKRTSKDQLLSLLLDLEGEVSKGEGAAISNWLGNEFLSTTSLQNWISDARRQEDGEDEELKNSSDDGADERTNGSVPFAAECCICMESLAVEEFPEQKITEICSHDPAVCRSCLTQSIDSQIPDVAWDQVRCPECSEPLPYDVVKTWASSEAFERYDQKSLLAAFRDIPNFAMCLGPSCDSGQIHETGDDQPIMTCTICHFKTCFTHKMPWHAGQTCTEYDAERKVRMEQEAASERLITQTTKKCPNPACGHGIEKNGGCDHMTCRQCNYGFCYICLAPWKRIMREGNTAHADTCRLHTRNLLYFDEDIVPWDFEQELEVELEVEIESEIPGFQLPDYESE